jgi:putative ABC transport system permease protein
MESWRRNLDELSQDVRYGIRLLLKNPGFSLTALLILALGIGANTTVFSVVNTVLLQPLPYANQERLVVFESHRLAAPTEDMFSTSPLDFADWHKDTRSFEQMAQATYWTFNLVHRPVPERVVGARVTGQFFPMLGMSPLLGRTLGPSDDQPGSADTVVLSYELWHRLFNADHNVIGQTFFFEGRAHVVVGVMPADFALPSSDVELWAPLADNMPGVPRNGRFLFSMGTLRPGITREQAQNEMDVISARLQQQYPDTNKAWTTSVIHARDALTINVRSALTLLMYAVCFVLLIACTNVANLLLSRAAARQKEFAVRTSLGARWGRLLRQTATENLLLTFAGAALGTFLSYFAVGWLRHAYPGKVPRLATATLDLKVLAFTIALALITGLALAMFSSLRMKESEMNAALKSAGRTASSGRKSENVRRLLAGTEIALAMVLLIGGGLLLRSFSKLIHVDPGFQTSNMLTMNVWLFHGAAEQKQYIQRALKNIEAVPGVESAAAITHLPLSNAGRSTLKFVPTDHVVPASDAPEADYRSVNASYFRVAGVPLLRGRQFLETDAENAPHVAIVNESLARKIWPGQDAVGKTIRWIEPGQDVGPITIVGLVKNVRTEALDKEDDPAVYIPYLQRGVGYMRWTAIIVHTRENPLPLWPAIRSAVLSIDPNQPIYAVKTAEGLITAATAERRFLAQFLGVFSALALLLAVLGTYGVISYSVAQRIHEFGIRMALGAQRRDVLVMVTTQAAKIIVLGTICGVVIALLLSHLLSKLLYGISSRDPMTFVVVIAILSGTALLAALVPARRATKVDPVNTLRYE